MGLPTHLHIIEYHHISFDILGSSLCSCIRVSWRVSRCIMWYHDSWYYMIYRDITVCALGAWAVVGGRHDIMWYHVISCRVEGVELEVRFWRYIIIYHHYIMCPYHVHVSSKTRHEITWYNMTKEKRWYKRYIMCRRGTWYMRYMMMIHMIHDDTTKIYDDI